MKSYARTRNMGCSFHLFQNKVYWITFGYKRPIEEEILIQLNRLYHLVKNLELKPEPLKLEPLRDSLIHFLRHHFSREEHCNALLILDDVCDSKIVEAFDFECKALVITANLDVVLEKGPSVIEVYYSFFVHILLLTSQVSNLYSDDFLFSLYICDRKIFFYR